MRPIADIVIINQSSRDLYDAQAQFGENICKWGTVGRTYSANYMYYPHPITMDVELSWTESGKQRVEKISLAGIYPVGESGRLTFIVHADRVEAGFIKSQ